MTRRTRSVGSVALVGAGPGDPGLITVRALALLRDADVVVYDRIGTAALLPLVASHAELVDAGKRPRTDARAQRDINTTMIERARAGRSVVRLKGGDPFVFGRGGEEAEALAEAGIPFEVVPGVTSAFAAPAAAGIPVTHREAASSVAVATAHRAGAHDIDWVALARADTAVLLMAVARLAEVARAMIAAGRSPATPSAVIQDATLPSQRTVTAALSEIADAAARSHIRAPAVLVVGDVVVMRSVIGGWDQRALSGVRVVVTRTREQASELSQVLRELGAEVLEGPAIRIEPPRSWGPLDRALARLGSYGWIVFTSANGVRMVVERLRAAGRDARAFAGVNVCAIGPGTATALAHVGIVADLMPASFTTMAIAETFPRGAGRVLLARADIAEEELDDALVAKGWTVDRVTAYRIVRAAKLDAPIRRAVLDGEVDVLTFASAGTVRAFMKLLRGQPPKGAKIVCIGPVTAREARASGLRVTSIAEDHTIEGLVAAVVDATRKRR